MGRPRRFLPYPRCLVEVSCRTFQSRKLLAPSAEVNDLVLGVLGKAAALYPEVRLVAYQVMGTHLHLLAAPEDHGVLSAFMDHALNNIAREVGGRLRGWKGSFWGGRFHSVPVLDEPSMVERLKYLLSNGTKEGLVDRPEDWPGVSSLRAQVSGKADAGRWYDRSAEYEARRRGKKVGPEDFAKEYEVPLVALPCWEELSREEQEERVKGLVREIEEEAAAKLDGGKVLGVQGVVEADAYARPEEESRSPAPKCHAASEEVRAGWRVTLGLVMEAFEAAAAALLAALKAGEVGEDLPAFPEGTFRPNGGWVGWRESVAPT